MCSFDDDDDDDDEESKRRRRRTIDGWYRSSNLPIAEKNNLTELERSIGWNYIDAAV
jgi:hypothetical protein